MAWKKIDEQIDFEFECARQLFSFFVNELKLKLKEINLFCFSQFEIYCVVRFSEYILSQK